jgi:uncharacterized paraquat-inducible protein A
MSNRVRNAIGLTLLAASFVALVPGLREPLITLTASVTLMGRTMELFRETRSILQTIQSLHDSGNDFVAGLILLFGLIVPIVKGGLLVTGLFLRPGTARRLIVGFARAISKWAMNDVFIVAVYVAFLSARATDSLDSKIEPGFYWFAAYCLLSLLSLQFLKLDLTPTAEGATPSAVDPGPTDP